MLQVLKEEGDRLSLRLQADLKMENAPEFFEAFQRAAAERHRVVLVDFSRIRFVDSSGVGILLKCAHSQRDRQGRFLVYGLSRSLQSVFKLAGLFKIFEQVEDDEALASFPELSL